MADSADRKSKKQWKPATRAVRGGLARSRHGEISEALYMTSGYAYDSAEQAAARMRGDEPGFVYSRYGSPTVEMLQQRLALIEGAETLPHHRLRHGRNLCGPDRPFATG